MIVLSTCRQVGAQRQYKRRAQAVSTNYRKAPHWNRGGNFNSDFPEPIFQLTRVIASYCLIVISVGRRTPATGKSFGSRFFQQ